MGLWLIYVFTSIINGFDNLRPPAAAPETFVKFICFTNVPNLPRVHPWEQRGIYPSAEGSAGRTSRIAKILPHLMLPDDAEFSIYLDGNFVLKADPHEIIEETLGDKGQWAAYQHPARSCVYDEAEIVLRDCPLVDKEAVKNQVARYQENGFPAKAGLWANGFLVRRHTPEVAKLNTRWWELFQEGSDRDQLSFPVAMAECGMAVNTIIGNVYASPYMAFRWHAPWKEREDNPDYWKERMQTRARLAELARLTGTNGGIKYGINHEGKPY